MSSPILNGRRVLVVGAGLMACAEQGLPDALIEPATVTPWTP